MDFSYKLIDYKTYTYNGKQFIKFLVYCKQAEYISRIIKLNSDDLQDFADRYIDHDIFENLTFKVSHDGTTKLDISI